jgi:hypothetical protein
MAEKLRFRTKLVLKAESSAAGRGAEHAVNVEEKLCPC